MRSPLQQSAAALREQIVDLYTVPLVDANFPDGGGDSRAIQLRQLPRRQQFLYPGQGQRLILYRVAQLVQLGLQRLLLCVIISAV